MDKIKNELAQTDGFDNWEQMINCYCTTEPGRRMINDRINKVLKLCNSYLQFNACFKIGDKVEFNSEKCTVEFFDKTTELYDLQKDGSNIIYLDVPVKVITPRSV